VREPPESEGGREIREGGWERGTTLKGEGGREERDDKEDRLGGPLRKGGSGGTQPKAEQRSGRGWERWEEGS
jgi:hypothetical protein